MRRVRLRTGPSALFLAAMVAAMLVFLPMRLVLGWMGLGEQGIGARAVTGSVWDGRLLEARIGDLPLGTLDAGLSPLSLLIGRARIDVADAAGTIRGALTLSRNMRGIDDFTATLVAGRVFAPLPVTALALENVTVHFVDGVCDRAEGRVRATLAGSAGGVVLPASLSGAPRCEGGMILLPLASQAGTEGIDLRIDATGHYSAAMRIGSADAAAAARLAAAGFVPGPGGYRLSIEGSF